MFEEYIIAVNSNLTAVDKIFLSCVAAAGTPESIFNNYYGREMKNIPTIKDHIIMNAIISDELEKQALVELVNEGKIMILEGDGQ